MFQNIRQNFGSIITYKENMTDTSDTEGSTVTPQCGKVPIFSEFACHKKFELDAVVHMASFSEDEQHSR